MKTVMIHGTEVEVVKRKYAGGEIALQLNDAFDGSPYAVATVFVEGVSETLAKDEAVIKTYSENEGIFEELVKADVLVYTGRMARVGFTLCPIARVLI